MHVKRDIRNAYVDYHPKSVKMVNYCRVLGCNNRSDRNTDKSFYRLPEVITNQGEKTQKLSSDRRRLWLANLSQDFSGKNLKNIRVCSDHFVNNKRAELYDQDNPSWAPTVNMGLKRSSSLLSPELALNRYKRRKDRNTKTDAAQTLMLLRDSGIEPEPEGVTVNIDDQRTKSVATQTDMDYNLVNAMESELQKLRTENINMKKRLKRSCCYSFESFEGNDEKVKFFTGLPSFHILQTLFHFLEPFLPNKQSIEKFNCLTVTLARLRLNLSVTHLAYQLNISAATVSRTLSAVVDVMYVRMKPLIMWPDREVFLKTMPMQFRQQFGMHCAVIIDCFEVFIERPSNLEARAETWSSYKHHNTVKFLLGITPHGVISFISRSWGGCSSDKHITENCGILDKVVPGDIILADKVFDIQSSVGVTCANVKNPAFTKDGSQLAPVDVETTRKLANVAIHVSKVIGLVRRKYSILSGTLPIDMVITKDDDDNPTVDKIATICCALVNLCESVVDFG